MRGVSKRAFLQCLDVGRATARRAGEMLAVSGVLRDPDDIFYLTVEELDRRLPADVQALVDRRRERRAFYQTLELPAMWKGSPTPRTTEAMHYDTLDHVEGIGVSRGVVEGGARVVHDYHANRDNRMGCLDTVPLVLRPPCHWWQVMPH
jgi:hypothetical protein